jgi:hypothetical protein
MIGLIPGSSKMDPGKVGKPWEYELIHSETEKYARKILFVPKGEQLSLQCHKVKGETMTCTAG